MDRIETLEQVSGEASQRLHPSLTNPSWLVLSKRREIFQMWIEKLPPNNLSVLDIGGRIQPYRPLLATRLQRYVAVDLRPTPLVNLLAKGEQLPLADSTFDLVICTQVLQYVPNPGTLLLEVHRVLKSNGCLFLSAPSAYPRDADGECWRFLPAGLRHMLSPFREVDVVPEGGSVAGFFRTMNVSLDIFVRYSALRSLFRHTACPLINLLGKVLDRLSGGRNDQFAVNYSVLARK
jgi:SAM-dependent methyltransferase